MMNEQREKEIERGEGGDGMPALVKKGSNE